MLSGLGRSPGHSNCLLQFLLPLLCRLAGAECLLFDSDPLSSTRCLGCWEETLSSFPRSPTHFNELAGSPAPHCPLASLPCSVPLRWLQAWPSFGQLPHLCCPLMASQIAWTTPPRFPPAGIPECGTPSQHCLRSCQLLSTHRRKNRRGASGGRRVPCPLLPSRSEQRVVRMFLDQHS